MAFQRYLAEEVAIDHADGVVSRREALRRLVLLGLGVPAAAALLAAYSACGYRDGPKPLSIRAWACQACGVAHDRDANAARNILVAAGLAETQNACGGTLSPGQALAVASEAGTHRGAA
jgi:hypothetical protein